MFRSIGTLIALGGLLLGATQTALANDRVVNHYESPRHYRVSVYRDDDTPRWLRKEPGFRGWYRHSDRKSVV